ncbi:MAG: hypothetical protein HYW57_04160 [Ignavibacteriales bacterium]|nr:hypothetical protein [Ignavibacteriales bacterium]
MNAPEEFVYERCLNEAERILAAEKDVIVAVKKVWTDVTKEGKNQGFEVPGLSDFTAMLEGDPRFEFLPSHKSLTEDLEDPLPYDGSPDETEMEQLGFFSGDRIKLRRIELTPQVLGTIIRSKVDRTMDALTKAWEARPEGDQETEDRLLEILARTQKLQQEVKKTFSKQRMENIERTLKRKKASARKRASRGKSRPSAKKRAPLRTARKKGKRPSKPVRRKS